MKIVYRIDKQKVSWPKNIVYQWIESNNLKLSKEDITSINVRTGALRVSAWKQAKHLWRHPSDNHKRLQETLLDIHKILQEYLPENLEQIHWFEHYNPYAPNECFVMNKCLLEARFDDFNLTLHTTAWPVIYKILRPRKKVA